ncbi:MAG: prepilin-type N-terminal cleavage/methylation domain-containing protein [Dehalococcoidia bacterium]|nr:prepilin-type N-terminal cleavage/methylation domain-containing protein [Dehalococcoidia bacterium]
MPRPKKLCKVLQDNSKGVGLVEALIAVAILGMIAVAFLNGLFTAFKSDIVASEQTTAESLARSELEYLRNISYDSFYNSDEPPSLLFPYELPDDPPEWDPSRALDEHYAGYTIDVSGVPIDPDSHEVLPSGDKGMLEMTVEVYHQGHLVLTTSTYKVSR